jgi:hypothetical protein
VISATGLAASRSRGSGYCRIGSSAIAQET